MSELKPCPFCGGEAQLMRRNMGDAEAVWIECKECGAMGTIHSIGIFKLSPRTAFTDPIFDRVKMSWNRRVEE